MNSSQKRQEYVFAKLMRAMEPVLTDDIAYEMNIGRSTLISDLKKLRQTMEKYELDFSQVAYMGDDEPDICILEKVAIAGCPADAVAKVQKVCNFKATKDGGRGAVRELCDFVFESVNFENE